MEFYLDSFGFDTVYNHYRYVAENCSQIGNADILTCMHALQSTKHPKSFIFISWVFGLVYSAFSFQFFSCMYITAVSLLRSVSIILFLFRPKAFALFFVFMLFSLPDIFSVQVICHILCFLDHRIRAITALRKDASVRG